MAENRAKKSGIGGDIDRKLEAKYDQEEAAGTTKSVVLWMNSILQGEHDPIPVSEPFPTQRDIHKSIRDGVMLCKLINKLLESEGKPKVHFQKKAATMFVAYTNIESYNNGCLQYGLAKEFTVQSADLWEGRKGPFLNVINNIHSLGFLANSKGFTPTYLGAVQKTADFD
ncbi:transgelin-2-like [Littorina saxatilis]|uniref:Calponin-homology (CH) domain-containing protein n=1 Tax=Littorina saxatilis TaxID=31220 RepID=A0AAN9B5L8_9CAEN